MYHLIMARGDGKTSAEDILYGAIERRTPNPDQVKTPREPKHRIGIRQAAVMQRLRQTGGCIFPAVKKYAEQPALADRILKGMETRGYVSSTSLSGGSKLRLWKLTATGETALSESRYSKIDLLD